MLPIEWSPTAKQAWPVRVAIVYKWGFSSLTASSLACAENVCIIYKFTVMSFQTKTKPVCVFLKAHCKLCIAISIWVVVTKYGMRFRNCFERRIKMYQMLIEKNYDGRE